MNNMSLRVAVVEDDAMMRLAVTSAVRMAGMEVAFSASTVADALDLAKRNHPDVAILDLHLGEGPTGLDLAVALRRQLGDIGLVFLTSFEDPRLLHASLPGIPPGSQYLTKGSLSEVADLVAAINKSVEGAKTEALAGTTAKLTNNQVELLRLVAAGFSNAEIARQKFMTEKSVEVAISRIAKALGLAANQSQNQRVHIARVYFRSMGINIQ